MLSEEGGALGFDSFTMLMLQLAVMLGVAVVCGRVAQRFGQPAVVGEIIGGILVGVTVLGALAPDVFDWLFGGSVAVTTTRDALVTLGMLFFLFVAGSEVDIGEVRSVGVRAVAIGLAGTLTPLAAGIALVLATPSDWWGAPDDRWPVAVFVGLCLANSANPVLARILMDLGLLKSDVGRTTMAATVVDDLVIWGVFAVLLGTTAPSSGSSDAGLGVSLLLVAAMIVLVVGGGRLLARPALNFLAERSTWPTGFLGCVAVLILAAAAASDAVGLHAFLGAFLAGVALAGHDRRHREAHDTMARFALGFFAPLYFVSMALGTDMIGGFDLVLVTALTLVACITKVVGVLLGSVLVGLPLDRTTWSVAWGLNARGATGIVLAGVGRTSGIIDERVFVALVVMSVLTTIMAGPLMSWSMQRGGGGDGRSAPDSAQGARPATPPV